MPKSISYSLIFLLVCLWAIATAAQPAYAQNATHVVQPGETLIEIAWHYGVSLDALRQANDLPHADFVEPGRTLIIPPSARPAEQAEQSSPVEPAADVVISDAAQEHIVQPGEDLGDIAARYQTTPEALAVANVLADPNLITPGQRLIIAAPSSPSGESGGVINTEIDIRSVGIHPDPPTADKWIDVDLTRQQVVAYVGAEPVRAFLVSTGVERTPTVKGVFNIWAKTPLQDMSGGSRARGDYYYAEDVPWVQYFYADYSFHGTYWHSNFGTPMSHGCVNMRTEDAKWLFDWASPYMPQESGWIFSSAQNPGTLVVVHD